MLNEINNKQKTRDLIICMKVNNRHLTREIVFSVATLLLCHVDSQALEKKRAFVSIKKTKWINYSKYDAVKSFRHRARSTSTFFDKWTLRVLGDHCRWTWMRLSILKWFSDCSEFKIKFSKISRVSHFQVELHRAHHVIIQIIVAKVSNLSYFHSKWNFLCLGRCPAFLQLTKLQQFWQFCSWGFSTSAYSTSASSLFACYRCSGSLLSSFWCLWCA